MSGCSPNIDFSFGVQSTGERNTTIVGQKDIQTDKTGVFTMSLSSYNKIKKINVIKTIAKMNISRTTMTITYRYVNYRLNYKIEFN